MPARRKNPAHRLLILGFLGYLTYVLVAKFQPPQPPVMAAAPTSAAVAHA